MLVVELKPLMAISLPIHPFTRLVSMFLVAFSDEGRAWASGRTAIELTAVQRVDWISNIGETAGVFSRIGLGFRQTNNTVIKLILHNC